MKTKFLSLTFTCAAIVFACTAASQAGCMGTVLVSFPDAGAEGGDAPPYVDASLPDGGDAPPYVDASFPNDASVPGFDASYDGGDPYPFDVQAPYPDSGFPCSDAGIGDDDASPCQFGWCDDAGIGDYDASPCQFGWCDDAGY